MNHAHLHGIYPGITILWFDISTYSLFVVLAFVVGIWIYWKESKRNGKTDETSFLIVFGAFAGSAIGSKLLEMLINIDLITDQNSLLAFLFSGRTVVGGIIGGTLGVRLIKYLTGKKEKRGNMLAPSVAIGIAIGRIGCFLNGCCYGTPTTLPWGVNFGDGIYRHPTQLYESIYLVIIFIILRYILHHKALAPGYLFKLFLIFYFVFRFLIEFIRVEKQATLGLSYFQYISLLCLIYLVISNNQFKLKQILSYGRIGLLISFGESVEV